VVARKWRRNINLSEISRIAIGRKCNSSVIEPNAKGQ
jgi:hypothetical protein